MANDSPLTKAEFLEAPSEFYSGHLKPEFDNINQRFKKVDQRFDRVEDHLNSIKLDIRGIKNEIERIKAELSGTATKSELNKLKEKVDRFHPTN